MMPPARPLLISNILFNSVYRSEICLSQDFAVSLPTSLDRYKTFGFVRNVFCRLI